MCFSFSMMIRRTRWVVALGAGAWLAACGGGPSDGPAPAATSPPAPAATPVGEAAPARPAVEAEPAKPVLEQSLAYGEARSNNLVGYLAMPADAAEPLPGIIVIHEWWGLTDEIKALTRRLASEGYVALAVDLYGGASAETPERAQALMTELLADPDGARANLRQAYDYLEKYAFAPRIGSIGWALGGGFALQTALLYPDALDAMVMYYGQVSTNREDLATLNVPILGFFAGEDASVPVRQVQDFRALLMQLGKNAEVLIMPGVEQAFANPSSANYDERAATEAWTQTLAFLQRNLKLTTPTQ